MLENILNFGKLIRFAHTIFALPFALAGLALATLEKPFSWSALLWILVSMVTARSAAMGFNRIIDRKYDAENPRTKDREIPKGKISVPMATAFVGLSSGAFIYAAFQLNFLCGALSPVALGILFFYSMTKRFTWASQLFLGLSLAIAPVGAWLALTGSFDLRIFLLAGAVLTWVAGFDIFYSCLDLDFDTKAGLLSVPRKWGLKGGIRLARVLHLITAGLLIGLYWLFPLSVSYLVGTIIVTILLAVENMLVRHDDLSKAMLAFNLNGAVSILYFFAVLAGVIF